MDQNEQFLFFEPSKNVGHKTFFKITIQAFHDFHGFDFCNFQFNEVYNSILSSSPLVLQSNLGTCGFCSPWFFYVSPHEHHKSRNACMRQKQFSMTGFFIVICLCFLIEMVFNVCIFVYMILFFLLLSFSQRWDSSVAL